MGRSIPQPAKYASIFCRLKHEFSPALRKKCFFDDFSELSFSRCQDWLFALHSGISQNVVLMNYFDIATSGSWDNYDFSGKMNVIVPDPFV